MSRPAIQNIIENPPLSQSRKPRTWGMRWSLRTLMIVMAVTGLLLSWAASYWRNIGRDLWVVKQIEAAGGEVTYGYEFGGGDELHFRLDSEDDPTMTGFTITGGQMF